MKPDIYSWFLAKQKLFANEKLCNIFALFERSDNIIEFLFGIRRQLVDAITPHNKSVFDTFGFFLDWQIEHLECINVLTKIGFVNGTSNLLRSIYITFAKIAFLRQNPDESENLRAGKSRGRLSDSSLLKSLENSGASMDCGLYGQLSKSVHANFTVTQIAQYARFTSQLNPKHYLMAEGIILQAQKFCLQSALEILRVLPNGENTEILSLCDAIDNLNKQWISDCDEMANRYEKVFGEKLNWGSAE